MFTLEQIAGRHAQVRSGADFPAYIRDLKHMGVICYETFVSDGHTQYHGDEGYHLSSVSRYEKQPIANQPDAARFKAELKAHQQGKSDYRTFCGICAQTGIEKWSVDLGKMTCTYFDTRGSVVLVEEIPG